MPFVINFVDDLLCYTDTIENNIEVLELLFKCFRVANFKISAEKSKFFQSSINFVGHTFSSEGVRPNTDKVGALLSMPVPQNKKQLKSTIACYNYYRRYIKGYSILARPLQELLKRDAKFVWEETHSQAFNKIRDALKNIPMLMFPVEKSPGPYYLTTDASNTAVSYVLTQVQIGQDGKEREVLIAANGRALRKNEENWSSVHKEMLAVLLGVLAHKHYFTGHKVIVRSDNLTVKFVKDLKKSTHGRLFRWALFLESIPGIEFEYIEGSRNHVADFLSRLPYDPPPPPDKIESNLIEEEIICSVTPTTLSTDENHNTDDSSDESDSDDDGLFFDNKDDPDFENIFKTSFVDLMNTSDNENPWFNKFEGFYTSQYEDDYVKKPQCNIIYLGDIFSQNDQNINNSENIKNQPTKQELNAIFTTYTDELFRPNDTLLKPEQTSTENRLAMQKYPSDLNRLQGKVKNPEAVSSRKPTHNNFAGLDSQTTGLTDAGTDEVNSHPVDSEFITRSEPTFSAHSIQPSPNRKSHETSEVNLTPASDRDYAQVFV